MPPDVAVVVALCSANLAACTHNRRIAKARAEVAMRGLVASGVISDFGVVVDDHPASVTVCVSGGAVAAEAGPDGCLWVTAPSDVLSPGVGAAIEVLES